MTLTSEKEERVVMLRDEVLCIGWELWGSEWQQQGGRTRE